MKPLFLIIAVICATSTYADLAMACMPPLPQPTSSSVEGERTPCLTAPELVTVDTYWSDWEIPLFHDPDRLIAGCTENLVIEIPHFSTQTLLFISSDGSTYHRDRDGVIHSGFPESSYFRGAFHRQTFFFPPEVSDQRPITEPEVQHIEHELLWTTTHSTSTNPGERFALDDDATWHTMLLKSQWYRAPDYCIIEEEERARWREENPDHGQEPPSNSGAPNNTHEEHMEPRSDTSAEQQDETRDEDPACAIGHSHHTPQPLTPLLLATLSLGVRRRAYHKHSTRRKRATRERSPSGAARR